MGLRAKFNLVLIFTFALGLTITGLISYKMLQENARQEVLHNAGIMMENALAIRAYTVNQIKPLLADKIQHEFLPQTVPAYAATQSILGIKEKHPDYTYKEATLNPTNPTSRAIDWEAEVVQYFRNHPNETEWAGERVSPTGPILYLSRPIKIKNKDCLSCHGKVEDAPMTMLVRYGDNNGFGWQMDEIVGAQIVTVPMSLPLQHADNAFKAFIISLSGVFIVITLLLNIMLHIIVIKPMKRIAQVASEVSLGQLESPELEVKGKDEIASVSESFNRMRRSLVSALNLLED